LSRPLYRWWLGAMRSSVNMRGVDDAPTAPKPAWEQSEEFGSDRYVPVDWYPIPTAEAPWMAAAHVRSEAAIT